MDSFTDTISISNSRRLKEAHKNLSNIDEPLIEECVSKLVKNTEGFLYLDDLVVHTIDRKGDSPHDHINTKEIVSGDATAWFGVGRGNEIQKFEIVYEMYAGSQGGNENDELIYDPIEVTVKPK